MATGQPTIFISYAHEDVEWKDRLVKQLNVLEAEGILDVWDDSEIGPGQDWNAEIERRIQSADVAILLISADFLTSKFIKANEIPPLLERRQRDGVTIFPVGASTPVAPERSSSWSCRPVHSRISWCSALPL